MNLLDIGNHSDRTLGKVLARQARDIGDATWLRSGDRSLTFGQANTLVNRYVNGLRGIGVERGAMVTMVMEPSIELVLIALAAARLGAVWSNISTDYRGQFLHEALEASAAKVLVIDGQLVGALLELPDRGGIDHVFINGEGAAGNARPLAELVSANAECEPCAASHGDVVQVWWSSGTTGKSKGVCHSHNSLIYFGHKTARKRVQPGDVLYSCTPMYLGSPWTGSIWPSLVGGVVAAIDPRFSVNQFWDRCRYYGATHFFTLGAMHLYLLKADPKSNDRDNRIRYGFAVPMPYELMPGFKARFAIEVMDQGYGTSETFQIFEALDDGTLWEKAALGRPAEEFEVAILDENDDHCPVGVGGEICIRPRLPNIIFSGYYRDPERTNKAWRNLWHHTGDMAYRGEDGIYYFADRKADYIRYKGRNISMFEVEQVIARMDDVLEAAAFGIQSEELESESELMVAVMPREGLTLTAQQVAEFVRDNAPYYFVPRYIDIVASLPKNAHGRTTKNDLRDKGLTAATWDQQVVGFKARKK